MKELLIPIIATFYHHPSRAQATKWYLALAVLMTASIALILSFKPNLSGGVLFLAIAITSKFMAWLGLAQGTIQKLGKAIENDINDYHRKKGNPPISEDAKDHEFVSLCFWGWGFAFLIVSTVCEVVKA